MMVCSRCGIYYYFKKLAKSGADLNIGSMLSLFGQEARRGFTRLIDGYIDKLIASIDNSPGRSLITLATLWEVIHCIILMCLHLAWLLRANNWKPRQSWTDVEYVDKFWELIDEVLNALLFVLIGWATSNTNQPKKYFLQLLSYC
jgi:CPA1 family monovalent cation:H+ antiporter